jgi:Ca2+-binding RTX toxin-like protein
VGCKGGIAILIAGVLLAVPATAGASMQLVSVTEPTPARTFVALHGTNDSTERDVVSVVPSGSNVVITDDAGIGSFPANCRRSEANVVTCPFSAYDDISLDTGPGNDRFSSNSVGPNLTLKQILGPNVAVYVNALLGPGKDRFFGGDATDAVFGGPGADRIFGGGGTDYLAGDAGNDRIVASLGRRDLMLGGGGRDRCTGEPKDLVSHCERVKVR